MPKEDVTIVLDVSPRVSYLRSIANNFVLDDFEKNHEFLDKVRNNYLELAKVFNWNVLLRIILRILFLSQSLT